MKLNNVFKTAARVAAVSILSFVLGSLAAKAETNPEAITDTFSTASVAIYPEQDYAGIYLSGSAARVLFEQLKVEDQPFNLSDGTPVAVYHIGEHLVCAKPVDLLINDYSCRVNFSQISKGKAYNQKE